MYQIVDVGTITDLRRFKTVAVGQGGDRRGRTRGDGCEADERAHRLPDRPIRRHDAAAETAITEAEIMAEAELEVELLLGL